MKMKTLFGSMAMMAAALTAPVTLTSCDDDDVNTIVQIISMFMNSNELQGTAWITAENSAQVIAIEFTDGTNGNFYDTNTVDSDGNAIAQPFTYVLDTDNNLLTLTFSARTIQFTVKSYTKNASLVLENGSTTYNLVPFTGE